MKLTDLFEADKTILNLTPRSVQSLDVLKGKMLGQGMQAVAVRHPKSKTVIKKVNITGDEDPAVKYVKLIANHQNNPFFPRIYSAKVYRLRDNGQLIMVMHMERLHEWDTPQLQDATRQSAEHLGFELSDFTLDDFDDRERIATATKNPKLKEALRLMEPLFQQFGSDLHEANWMVRLTSTGPQLVFADPFFESD